VPIQLTFIIVTAILAALVGLGALVALLMGRSRTNVEHDLLPTPAERERQEAVADAIPGIERRVAYESMLRILWWITIAVVLVGVGVSDAYQSQQPLIFGIGGLGVLVVLGLHELLPLRFRSATTRALEALVALALVSALLVLTGYGNSPFFFAFDLVAVAVALGHGGRIAFLVAAVVTLAYLGVLGLDPNRGTYGSGDLLRFGLNIGSVWLLSYLAGVFAAEERRVRKTFIGLSQIDPLTGLYNRGQIFATLEQEVSRTRRSDRGFCLLMVDLDGLKGVNDTFGHHRGDEVLRALGTVVRRSIRAVDTAYRYGGDEFLVLLPETDIAGAFVVAEKIRAGVEDVGLALGGGEVATSVSIGLVSHPEDGTTAEELVIAADRAMYQAKSLGKNQISGVPRVRRRTEQQLPLPAPTGAFVEVPQPAGPVAIPIGASTQAEPETAAQDVRPEVAAGPPPEPAPPVEPIPDEPVVAATAPPEPVPAPATAARQNGAVETGEEEPDPGEVRRQIAVARRSFDPDHQIRRAMDAFLSSTTGDEPRHPDA
jgi:diguanylate cyclase (GGDEF)-like protein